MPNPPRQDEDWGTIYLPFANFELTYRIRDGQIYSDYPPLLGPFADRRELEDAIHELEIAYKMEKIRTPTMEPFPVYQRPLVMTPSDKLLANVPKLSQLASAQFRQQQDASSSKQLLDATALEKPATASPQTVPHTTIDGSSSTSSFRSEEALAAVGDSTSALTLQDPDDSSSEMSTDTTSSQETIPSIGSPLSDSLGSKILFWVPKNWYKVYYVRMDSSGSFRMFPDLGGPFHSLDEAEDALNHHLGELERQAIAWHKEQGSLVNGRIDESKYYLDGAPKRGPNAIRQKDIRVEQCYLVDALVDQYNDDHNLFGDLAHKLESLVMYETLYDVDMWFYHFNFTTRTREAGDICPSSGNLFFAEVSHRQGGEAWKVNCCSVLDSNDNGHCFGCRNNGNPHMKHPNNTDAYFCGYVDGYLPFGDDEISNSDTDEEPEEA